MHHICNIGTGSAQAVGATCTITTTTSVLEGEAVLVWAAWDSRSATEIGPLDWRWECKDDYGNTWVTGFAGQYGVGANAAACSMVFFSVIRNPMPAGAIITITDLVNSGGDVAKAMSAHKFGGLTKKNLHVGVSSSSGRGATMPTGEDSDNPAACTLADLESREYIFAHAIGMETGKDVASYTQDSDYTDIVFAGTTLGTDHQNICIKGGFRIATLTGDTCDVDIGATTSLKQGLVALFESDAPGVRWSAGTGGQAGAPNVSLRGASTEPFTQQGDLVVGMMSHTTNRYAGLNKQSHMLPDALHLSDVTTEIFWFRAAGDETDVSGQDIGNQILDVICFYGAAPHGCPFYTLTTGTAASGTDVTVSGGTTDNDETGVLAIITHGIDAIGAQLSGWAASGLTAFMEQVDGSSNLGNGMGHGAAYGIDAVAGSTGDVTATLAANNEHGKILIALPPADTLFPDVPWIEKLDAGASTAGVTLVWNANRVDEGDVIVVGVSGEGPANAGVTVDVPTGYTRFADSPKTIGDGTSTDHQIDMFWKKADGTETGVTVSDAGDHTDVAAFVIKNADAGYPETTSGAATTTSSTSLFMPLTSLVTTRRNCLVCVAVADNTDNGERMVYDADSSTSSLVGPHRYDESMLQQVGGVHTAQGRGGGFNLFAGVMESPGAVGQITASLDTASKKCWHAFAFAPDNDPAETQVWQTQAV